MNIQNQINSFQEKFEEIQQEYAHATKQKLFFLEFFLPSQVKKVEVRTIEKRSCSENTPNSYSQAVIFTPHSNYSNRFYQIIAKRNKQNKIIFFPHGFRPNYEADSCEFFAAIGELYKASLCDDVTGINGFRKELSQLMNEIETQDKVLNPIRRALEFANFIEVEKECQYTFGKSFLEADIRDLRGIKTPNKLNRFARKLGVVPSPLVSETRKDLQIKIIRIGKAFGNLQELFAVENEVDNFPMFATA